MAWLSIKEFIIDLIKLIVVVVVILFLMISFSFPPYIKFA